MSAENKKVCCNCRHCIREQDEKYDMIVCRCKRYNRYLSYAEVMSGFCKRWAKVNSISRMYENAGIAISCAFLEGYGKEGLKKMTADGKDRIKCAIRHIKTAVDVDPWAVEISVEAMEKQIPKKPNRTQSRNSENLWNLYCPSCGNWIGMYNSRLKRGDMHNISNEHICPYCGQAIDWEDFPWNE